MKKLKFKFVKIVKKQAPWIDHLINDEKAAGEFNTNQHLITVQSHRESLCLMCRGTKMLCGKNRCPALIKLYSLIQVKKQIHSNLLVGSSPPGIFVGRIGYPYVYAGPLVPPILGDTSMHDSPEKWIGKSFNEIIGFRTNLIRGKFRVNVKKPEENQKFVNNSLDIALSKGSVDTELVFKNKPSGRLLLDESLQPMGPSGLIKKLKIENAPSNHKLEKAFEDDDLRAEEAIFNLHKEKVPVSKIQRAFSVGAFGLKKNRKLVPTRWSITAVDSTLSRKLIEEKVKRGKIINEYRVYDFQYLGNQFVILLTPSHWEFEWIEAWYPGTPWNLQHQSVAMGNDWEGYKGRTTYASIGGCYYSVRLATAEFLAGGDHQAGVIAMREIHPSFLTPLGVWINRECVRKAFTQQVMKFATLQEALDYIVSKFSIKLKDWINSSVLLKEALYQEKMTKYLKFSPP